MIKRVSGAILAMALAVSFFMFFSVDVSAASAMSASDDCIRMIQDTEGFRAIPYWDYSQWTVGFGSTCPSEDLERYKEDGIPVEEAYALFAEQLAKFERAVNKFADKHGLSLSQQQFDALVSFSYNLGSGVLGSTSNTIVKAVLKGATENELIHAFSVYCMAGGEFLPGLMRRRLAEANMYLNGIYDEYAPENYCYVRYDANGGVRDCSAQGYDCNLAAVPLSRPTYSGYTFVGWYTKPEGGVKITALDETTAGMTLYAHWEKGESTAEEPTDPVTGINVSVLGSVVHVRTGPGLDYGIAADVYAGQILTITGTTKADGILWGQCAEGWVSLNHTTYFDIVKPEGDEEETKESVKLPAAATVTKANGITVYTGPHTTYPKVKTLSEGTVILLEEAITFAGDEWARCEDGWVLLGDALLVHDENMLAHSFTVEVTYSSLAVRSGPGTSNSKVTSISKGTTHTVYAVTHVNGAAWGRIAKGWISLSYTDYDASKLAQYQDHSYGDWYSQEASTCVTHGVDRRDCLYCDTYETREAELGDHSYGDWYVTKAPTTKEPGQERRDCQHCDHYETQEIERLEHDFGDWYVAEEATCTEPGQERRDCKECDHYESRELTATGHSYGDWYESVAPTVTEYGEERRDCQHCDHYETRQTDKLPAATITRTYATVTCTTLRIRSGPGSSYTQVGKLYKGDVVEILQIETVGSVAWGLMDKGWICLTGYAELSYEEQTHTHSFGDWYVTKEATTSEYGEERRDCTECDYYETRQTDKLSGDTITRIYATVTYSVLRIRSGPGSSYEQIGRLYKGDVVEILQIVEVDSVRWGKIESGWIWLTGYTELSYVEEAHTHSYGDWYVTKEATTTEYGQERRDCTGCSHYETRQTEKLTAVTRVYATITCKALSIREGAGTGYDRLGYYYKDDVVEILEQKQVGSATWGRTEKGWICLTGYATLKTITE